IIGDEKAFQIGAQRKFLVAENDIFGAVAKFVENGTVVAELQPPLVDVVELRQLPDLDGALCRRQLTEDNFEQRCLAESVAGGDTDAITSFEFEVEVRKKSLTTEFNPDVGQFDDAIAELRRRRNDQVDVALDVRARLRGDFVIAFDAVFLFGPSSRRTASDPFE